MNIGLTLIGQTIAFFVFVWICMRYIWPPITQAMSERQQRIAEGLAAAERASKDLELAQKRATDELRHAKEEARELLDKAQQRAAAYEEEQRQRARETGDQIVEQARADAQLELGRMKEELRKEVATLAVLGAEQILEQSVDARAHSQLLDKLSTQL